ncbi:MAG: hypothetical protein ACOX7F_07790 [Eubacteriales bacterium]|jgi:hypothetical protein
MKERVEIVEEYGQDGNRTVRRTSRVGSTAKAGISFGSCLAMVISFVTWKSIPWAIFHGLLGWIYVIYFALRY